jgi:CBS domain-containing protein
MRINTFMIPFDRCVTCTSSTSLAEVGETMSQRSIGCVVVVSGGKPVGVITKSDLLRALFQHKKEAATTPASDIMSRTLYAIEETKTTADAAELISKYRIHHLVVVDNNGCFAGLLSSFDIVRELNLDNKAFPYSREMLNNL